MPRTFRLISALLSLGLSTAGCGILIGIDDFKDAPATGGTGGTPTGGTGGTGAAGGTGGTGATGGTGGTGGSFCTPGESIPCYEGPQGTANVGACQEGTQTCNDQGTAYGLCKGQVLPAAAEDCLTPADDDCDNLNNEKEGCCNPNDTITCYTGPVGTQNVGQCKPGTTLCPATGIIPSTCPGEVLPADEFCSSASDEDCNGKNCWVWTVAKGGFGLEFGSAVATKPFTNQIAFAGSFKGSLDLGGGTMNSQGANWEDIYLSVFNPDGSFGWAKQFGGEGGEAVNSAAWDGNQGILIAGSYIFGDLDLGGGMLGQAQGQDGYIGRFDNDGNHFFSLHYGGGNNQLAHTIRWMSGGYVVAGEFNSNVMYAGPANTFPLTQVGGNDLFVIKYDNQNQVVWTRVLGGSGAEAATGSNTMDADFINTAIYVLGRTDTVGLDLGKGPLPTGANTFLARLDDTGQTVWSKGWTLDSQPSKLTTFNNNIYVASTLTGPTSLEADTFTPSGTSDILVTKLDSSGNIAWTFKYGETGGETLSTITADKNGVWIAGNYDKSFILGGSGVSLPDPASPQGGSFVAQIDLNGNVVWAHALGDSPAGIAVDGAGFTIVGGAFGDVADFGGGGITAVGSLDVFLTKLGR
ncbi:MAG: hypothetical protein IPK82_20680 [Polyangiaceae bacterium]|nr:hypothetical protein [Polyangiaceae bacterium]